MSINSIEADWKRFESEWKAPSPYLEVQTSGSTGTPKRMLVRKEQMIYSARMTLSYLGLRPGDKALLCLPLRYIAGKMMAVRAWVGGLDLLLREPSGHPLAEVTEPIRFAAMIPMQVYNSLQVEEERQRLATIDILIIGGGPIDAALEQALQALPGRIYSTYGMTETLSHIALRQVNGPEASAYYTPLPGVSLSLSEAGTLVVDAPGVSDQTLVTNDCAELLPDGRFAILGRRDNVIVSGGVKLHIEQMEERLHAFWQEGFAVTSLPDVKFGEAVVWLLTPTLYAHWQDESFRNRLQTVIPRYEWPKQIALVEDVPLTETGKINRAACKELALKQRITN